MKNFIYLILMLAATQVELHAQVDIGLALSGNTLTVSYTANVDYSTAPADKWNGQAVTLAYPSTATVAFSAFVNSGPFAYVMDGSPVDGGDGFYYQKFNAADVNLTYALTTGASVDVFSVNVNSAAIVAFELKTGTAWTIANNADAAVNNAGSGTNVFGSFVSVGDDVYDGQGPVATIASTAAPTTTTSPIPYSITFDESPVGFTASDLDLLNAQVSNFTTSDNLTWTFDITPYVFGNVTVGLEAGQVQDAAGNPNPAATAVVVDYQDGNAGGVLVEYLLERLPDGYYQVSMVSNVNYAYPNNITSTAQVTLKVATGSGLDSFTVTDLTPLITSGAGVGWALNSREDTPTEDVASDYITFGMTSYGTTDIPYVAGDTTALFKFRNTGRCLGTDVSLMALNDAFLPPNSRSANVGCQLSVSGYNQPDVPVAVTGTVACASDVFLSASALLQGAYDIPTGLMNDHLRAGGYLPTTEPYSAYEPNNNYFPFMHVNNPGGETVDPGVFAITGDDAIVDWVFLELRNPADSTEVLMTRAALLQRDGDIVDTDGVSAVKFSVLVLPTYYVAVRHRNHLGVMTLAAVDVTGTGTTLYTEDSDTPLFGTDGTYTIAGKQVLWGGNSNADPYLAFQGIVGQGPDNDRVFFDIFNDPLNVNYSFNYVSKGYYPGDNNLDGEVKFQGPGNDLDQYIFFNVIVRHPGNVGNDVNYYISQQLPD